MNQVTEVLEPDPVFVDSTGRRRRLARNVGIAISCALAGCLAILAFGLVTGTGTGVPLTPWPDAKPSRRDALPGHGQLSPKRGPSPATVTRPAAGTVPSAAPTSRHTSAPTARPGPATAHPTAARRRRRWRTAVPS